MRREFERPLLLIALAFVLAIAWSKPLEIAATQQIDDGMNRALASFATARTLNAIISVAQGTEMAVEPAGIGVNLAPGQVLRPINDLVSQLAELMLAASVAFGVMKLLILIGSYWIFSLLLSAFALGWIWLRWRQREPPVWLARVLFVLLLVRFAVPLVAVGNDMLFQGFLLDDYTASQNAIDSSAVQLEALTPPANETDANKGIVERFKKWWDEKTEAIGSRLQQLKQIASQLPKHIVNLIVVFLMQTIVMPLLLLWALYLAGKAMLITPRQT